MERLNEYLYYEFSPKTGFKMYKAKDNGADIDDARYNEGNYFNTNHLWRLSDIVSRLNETFGEFKYANN